MDGWITGRPAVEPRVTDTGISRWGGEVAARGHNPAPLERGRGESTRIPYETPPVDRLS